MTASFINSVNTFRQWVRMHNIDPRTITISIQFGNVTDLGNAISALRQEVNAQPVLNDSLATFEDFELLGVKYKLSAKKCECCGRTL